MKHFFRTVQNIFFHVFFLCFRFAGYVLYYLPPHQFVYKPTISRKTYIYFYSTHFLNTFLSSVFQSPKFIASKNPSHRFTITIINQEYIKLTEAK